MFTATVPCEGGALPEQVALVPDGVAALLEGTGLDGLALPCRAGDPDLWFAEAPHDLERAKQLCADCPVRAQCLEGALVRREPWGVWGGEIFERGSVVARKRPRGRPRKSEQAITGGQQKDTVSNRNTARKQEAAA